jgi:hypothetical protein
MPTGADLIAALKRATLRPREICGQQHYIRGLTGAERQLLSQRARDGSPLSAAEIVALALCDDHGNAMLTAEQAAELANTDGAELDAVATDILRASKLLPDDVEEAAKN